MNKISCFVDEAELNLYLDNELPADRQLALREHTGFCFDCAARYAVAHGLKDMMQRAGRAVKAPAALREQIRTRISDVPTGPMAGVWMTARNVFAARPILPLSIAALLVGTLFTIVWLRPSASPDAPKLVSEMVHEHDEYVQAFETDRGIQSADPQEIMHWVAANSDLKIDLAQCDRFPSLYGACELEEGGRDVTCLFFDRGERRVSLFMMRAGSMELPRGEPMTVNEKPVYCGRYIDNNYVLWKDEGIVRILVSRLPEEVLIQMAEKLI